MLRILNQFPIRAAIGTALALISYFVISVYKKDVENQIRRINDFVNSASEADETILSARVNKGVLYNFDELIATERLNVFYMRTLLPSQNVQPIDFESNFVVGTANNESRRIISDASYSFLEKIAKRIPSEIGGQKIASAEFDDSTYFAGFDEVRSCFEGEDNTDDTAILATYQEQITDFEKEYPEAASPTNITFESYPLTARRRYNAISVVDGFLEIAALQVVSDLPEEDQRQGYIDIQNNVNRIRLKCLDDYRSEHVSSVALVLAEARQRLADDILPELYAKKSRYETLEILLYVVGALFAFSKDFGRRA